MIERKLHDVIKIIPFRNTMAEAILISSVESSDVAHLELYNIDIIQMVQEAEEEEENEEYQVKLVETSKGGKVKSLAATASILDLSIPAERVFHRRIRRLQMSTRMDDTTHSTLKTWLH